jgi:predicted dehydrogenase
VNPLRLAVIGAGHLGRIHARIASGLAEIELVAVADPVAECRASAAAEGGTRPVADYRELIGEIDAAIVATPTNTHHAVGVELLASGIPLLVEKPLAPNAAAASELVNLARRQGLVLQVGHVERFNPALAWAASEVRDPKYIEATRTSSYSFRSTDIGVVLDVMIHDLDVVLALANSTVTNVEALGISVLGGHEDLATARLTFASGCVAQLTASRVSPGQRRTMNIFTSRSAASIDFASREASLIKPREDVLRRKFRVDRLTAEERAHWKEHLFDELLVRSEHVAAEVNAIEEEQRDFVTCVRTGKTPRVDGAAGRDAIAVAELILAKIEEHAWDGTPAGRQGPFAMPALPIVPAAHRWHDDDAEPRRRAG